MGPGDWWHHHLGWGFHHILLDLLQCTLFQVANCHTIQAANYQDFPRKPWLHYDIAFQRDAGACDLRDWSSTNLDFYNFHTRTSSFQSGSSSNGSHSLFIPLPCCPISVVHEIMVPTNDPVSDISSCVTLCTSWQLSRVLVMWWCCWTRTLEWNLTRDLSRFVEIVLFCFVQGLQSWNRNNRPFGLCRYCHCCEKCEGDHLHVNCPLQASRWHIPHTCLATPTRNKNQRC